MKKEVNYPIKYAVYELKIPGGYSTEYKDITKGFIVSKCYVVGSSIKYYEDGSNKIFHKVVFPFGNIETFINRLRFGKVDITDKTIPSYDASGHPYPAVTVSDLFDTYEEADVLAQQKNKEFKSKISSNIYPTDKDFKKKLENLKRRTDEDLDVCKLFERIILTETEDMNISSEIEDKRLRLFDGNIHK